MSYLISNNSRGIPSLFANNWDDLLAGLPAAASRSHADSSPMPLYWGGRASGHNNVWGLRRNPDTGWPPLVTVGEWIVLHHENFGVVSYWFSKKSPFYSAQLKNYMYLVTTGLSTNLGSKVLLMSDKISEPDRARMAQVIFNTSVPVLEALPEEPSNSLRDLLTGARIGNQSIKDFINLSTVSKISLTAFKEQFEKTVHTLFGPKIAEKVLQKLSPIDSSDQPSTAEDDLF